MGRWNRGQGANRVTDAARDVADSRPMDWLARAGLTARGLIYLLMGVLAMLLAFGQRKEVDQRGALTQVASQPSGRFLVLLLAIGFAAYALWRLSEAAFGAAGEGRKAGPRLRSLARGIAYAVLAFTAVSVLRGTGQSQSAQQQGLSAKLMAHSGGRFLVGLIGAVIVGVAIFLIAEGFSGSFMRHFKATPAHTRELIRKLGTVGTVGRGVVFALVGAFIVSAAWTYSPKKAGGIDVVLKTTLGHAYGRPLVFLAALGLMAFGVYGLAEARYRRV
jgi:Domain of Unknown Function (DUF1206)